MKITNSRAAIQLRLHDRTKWEAFLGDSELAPGARSVPESVVRCWHRSLAFGVDPIGTLSSPPIEAETRLRHRRSRLDRIRLQLRDAIEEIGAEFIQHDFIGLFADPSGVVIDRFGGGHFKEVADKVRLIEGAHWSEAMRGTNAIGTSIAEGSAVEVQGAAHFAATNHGLVCYADVIRDATGELVAVFDATSMVQRASDSVALLVSRLCTTVERGIFGAAWKRARLGALERSIQRSSSPAFVWSRVGHLVCASDPQLAANELLVWELDRAFDGEFYPARGELSPTLSRLYPGFSVSYEPVADTNGDTIAVAAFLEPKRRARLIESKPGGFAFESIEGSDPLLRETINVAQRVAPTQLPILILAETGTGKDRLAQGIHLA
ncbi:MAG: sigma 54-interacting transcriptional regulator, partial [Myxococcota bacterium]